MPIFIGKYSRLSYGLLEFYLKFFNRKIFVLQVIFEHFAPNKKDISCFHQDKLPHSYPTKTHGKKVWTFSCSGSARACATELTKERSKWRARARGHIAKKIQKLALGDLSIKYFRIRHRHDNHMSKVKLQMKINLDR